MYSFKKVKDPTGPTIRKSTKEADQNCDQRTVGKWVRGETPMMIIGEGPQNCPGLLGWGCKAHGIVLGGIRERTRNIQTAT